MRSIALLVCALVCTLAVAACGGASRQVLRFTAIPDQNTTELREKFDPVAKYLSGRLGIEVEYVPSSDYGASVEMFKNGDVQMAWFGGLTGVQARAAVKGAHAIAQGKEDPAYYSYFIAHKDTGLNRSDEFPPIGNRKFTFGSDKSTSGRLMPEHFIRANSGKSPEDFFGGPNHYSGSHDKTAELVESGQFEVGALSYMVYEKRVRAGKTDPGVCKVIWKTPPYADYNITAHPDLEKLQPGLTEKLKRALIEMNDPKLLGAFQRSALIAATDADFAKVRELAKQLDMVR